MRKNVLLGDFLVEQELISEEQLRNALKHHHDNGIRLGRALIELGCITEKELIKALGEQLGVQYVNLKSYRIDPAVINLLPAHLARNFLAIPLFRIRDRLTVALENPLDIFAIDALTRETKMKIEPVVSSELDLREALDTYYPDEDAETPAAPLPAQAASEPVVTVVNHGDEKESLISEIESFLDRLVAARARRAFVIGGRLRVELDDKIENWSLPQRTDGPSFVRVLCNLGEEKNAMERNTGHYFIEKTIDGSRVQFHLMSNATASTPALTIHVQMHRKVDEELAAAIPELEAVGDHLRQHGGITLLSTLHKTVLDALFYAVVQRLAPGNIYPITLESMPTASIPPAAQFICESKAEAMAALRFALNSGVDALYLKALPDEDMMLQLTRLAATGCSVLIAATSRTPWQLPALLQEQTGLASLSQAFLVYPESFVAEAGLAGLDRNKWEGEAVSAGAPPVGEHLSYRWVAASGPTLPAVDIGEQLLTGLRTVPGTQAPATAER